MIFCYQRLTRGYGDAIMLRPAIIGSMVKYPEARHILHCLKSTSPIFRDIQGLEIITFEDGKLAKAFDYDEYCKLVLESRKLINRLDGEITIFQLSKSESEYEFDNAPYVIENGKYVATGRRIRLSRQDIWCRIVGVPFSIENYNVKFFDSELEYADRVLSNLVNPLVIHLNSVDKARSYKYPDAFINYFAKKWDGDILVLDHEYRGTAKNVFLLKADIRKAWAVISKCKALVGIDSFGIHASGSTGVFTYGIFGPTDPKCRLLYKQAVSSSGYDKCGLQPCWYCNCQHVPCINTRKPSWYWLAYSRHAGDSGINVDILSPLKRGDSWSQAGIAKSNVNC